MEGEILLGAFQPFDRDIDYARLRNSALSPDAFEKGQ